MRNEVISHLSNAADSMRLVWLGFYSIPTVDPCSDNRANKWFSRVEGSISGYGPGIALKHICTCTDVLTPTGQSLTGGSNASERSGMPSRGRCHLKNKIIDSRAVQKTGNGRYISQ